MPVSNNESFTSIASQNVDNVTPSSTVAEHAGTTYTVTFPDTAVRSPGNYRLLYFTRNSDSILGMSDCFTVEDNLGSRVPLDW